MSAPDLQKDSWGERPIGYAVVGLGHIAQSTILPAFARADRNSRLVAVVSSDEKKRDELGEAYGVPYRFGYDAYEDCLALDEVDAVYIALPNHLHAQFAVRAAQRGVHVLCEKPMALTEQDCRSMIAAARDHHVKLMVAYRLHFEESNLHAIELARSGALGQPRVFNSVFTYQVAQENIRLQRSKGGGPLWDIGVYCVNAARYLFGVEPTEVYAAAIEGSDERFREVEEGIAAILRFDGDKMATFVCSYGAASVGSYRLVGTRGSLQLQNAYDYTGERRLVTTVGDETRENVFPQVDQFGPQLLYFSDCIIEDREPEPDGEEGLADVRIIRALYHSTAIDKPVGLEPFARRHRPEISQAARIEPVQPAQLVDVEAPVSE